MKSLSILLVLVVYSCKIISAQTPSLRLDPAGTTLMEGSNTMACVSYDTAPSVATSIVLTTQDGDGSLAAQGPGDFTLLNESLSFGPSLPTEQCRNIDIILDFTLENFFEQFSVVATFEGTDITGSPIGLFIQSADTAIVGFSETSYSFAEDMGGQFCIVFEQGGVELEITLSVSSMDGTATVADNDYNAGLLNSGSITLDGSTPASGQCFNALITSDNEVEDDETFTITLTNTNQVTLSPTNSQATITILNDDANCDADPPSLVNGAFILSNAGAPPSMRGDTASYSCNTGYQLNGTSVLSCELGNVWSPEAPGTCQVIDCGALAEPANGIVDTSAGTRFPSGTATYSCDDGYIISGIMNRTCQSNQTWSGEAPTCEGVDCGALTNPVNGIVDTSAGTRFPSGTATYSCDDGYIISGMMNRTCQSNQTWSGEAPTCEGVNCGALTNPVNGIVDTSAGTRFPSGTATYSCDDGYIISGIMNRTCQSDQTWSGEAPTCEAVDCGALTNPANGIVDTSAGTRFPSGIANYSCDISFSLTAQGIRTCQSDGQWSGVEPTCVGGPVVDGGLTQEQIIGIGVGVGVGGAILIFVVVVVVIVIIVVCTRKRKADKYVLNYSTTYGGQGGTALTSKPVEPAVENIYQGRDEEESPASLLPKGK